jgi:hypothetical protein
MVILTRGSMNALAGGKWEEARIGLPFADLAEWLQARFPALS